MNTVFLAILGYVALQLLFGFWVARRIHTESDYLIAGRSLGPWLAAFTIFATWFGAETCIGAAGEAYSGGLSATRIDPFGYALGIMAMGLVFAVPLWRRRLTTLADLFRERYGLGVERYAALIMIPTSLLWAAAQVRAFGQVLAASSELEVSLCITLAAAVVVVYTVAGGLLADAWSDLLQGVVLICGLALLAILVFSGDGGAAFAALPPDRLSLRAADESWLISIETWAVPILGSIAAQELASRIIASRSPGVARHATLAAGTMYLCVGLIPVGLGLTAFTYLGEVEEPEQVLLHLAQGELPTFLYILFAGALVSAILSTVDSALLVAGSLAAHNLLLPLKPDWPERYRLRANRIAVACFGVIAWIMALLSEGVYALVEEASSLGSAGILVLMIFGLWGRSVGGSASAHAALTAGLGTYLLGAHALDWETPYILSIAAAFLGYLAMAAIGSRPEKSRTEPTWKQDQPGAFHS